jgi:hypothetical protein
VVVVGKWVIEPEFNDRVDGLGRIAGGGHGMLEPS